MFGDLGMNFIKFCRTVYFLLFVLWFPVHAYAATDEVEEPFVFTDENKQRMRDIGRGYSTSSSGVTDEDDVSHDVLGRSTNFFRYDSETTGVLGDQTQTMDFSSNGSIKGNAAQFENTLIGSGDSSGEGRVYKLLNSHRNTSEFKAVSYTHLTLPTIYSV